MQRNGEIIVVDVPKVLENAFRLTAVLTKTSVVRCALMSR